MAEKAASLKKNMLYGFIGNVIFALTQWGIVAVVARLGTPEEVGAVTIATALVTPIFFLSGMSLRHGHAVDDLTEFTRQDYFTLRLVSSLLAMGLIAALVATWYGDRDSLIRSSVLAFMLVKYVGSQSEMNYGVFQREQRMDFVALSFAARGLLGLASFATVYAIAGTLWMAFLAEAVTWAATVWLVDYRFMARLGVSNRFSGVLAANPRRIGRLVAWMLPLGLAGFLMNASASAPRLVLERYVDLQVVGVFGAIAYINTALAMISNAIGAASVVRLRKAVREGRRRRFQKLSLQLVGLSFLLGVALVAIVAFAGDVILTLLYGPAFANAGLFLIVISATALQVASAPLQFSLTAGHAYWRRLGINGAAFLLTLVSALVLVPDTGAQGAAWAMIVGAATRFLLLAVFFFHLSSAIKPPAEDSCILGGHAE